MRGACIFICVFLWAFNLSAGRVEKGFEALTVLDYFKAKEYFVKALEKEPAGGAYGLTLVYFQDKSPFYNIDSAYKYLAISDKAFQTVDEKQKEALTLLGIDQEAINTQHQLLGTAFYALAVAVNTQESYQDFIDYHPLANERAEAITLRNHLAFEKAQNQNTLAAMTTFMKNYPDADDFDLALELYYTLEYHKLTQPGNAYSYQVFIANKPENPNVKDAQIMVYQLYTASEKSEDYEAFIAENPTNFKVNDAWQMLFAIQTSSGSPAAIAEFIIDYPEYPDKAYLKAALQLAQLSLFPAATEDKYGFVDTNGTWQIAPIYEWVTPFSEGKSAVGLLGNTVYIDKTGKVLYHHILEDAGPFENNLAIIEYNEKYGVINFLGDTVVPVSYEELGEYSDGLIYAGTGTSYGYFNTLGELVVPFKYDMAYDFNDGKALVSKNGVYGVINVLGQEIIPPTFKTLLLDSAICIASDGTWYGAITYAGDTVIPFEFERISSVSEGKVMAVKEGTYHYYLVDGNLAFSQSFGYNEATFNYSKFSNGVARVSKEDKVGVINAQGEKVYPMIFADIGKYNADLTPVNKTGLWGYANQKVRLEIPYSYVYASSFEDSLAVVQLDTVWGIIDRENNFVIAPTFTNINRMDTLLLVEMSGKMGVLSLSGDTLLPIKYTKIEREQKDPYTLFYMESDGKQEIYWLEKHRLIYREE